MFQRNNLVRLLILVIFVFGLLFLVSNPKFKLFLKNNLSENMIKFIKEKVLVYSTIENQKKDIKNKGKQISELRKKNKKLKYQLNYLKNFSKNGTLIEDIKIDEFGIRKFNSLKKFSLESTNIEILESEENFSGSFYIEKYNDNILINFANGNMYFFNEKNLNEQNLNIKSVPSNIKSFLDNSDEKNITSMIRDSKIVDNKIYLSYAKKIKKSCYNTSILYSEINLEYMKFDEFFSYPSCVSTKNVVVGTGGRIEKISKNDILLTIGEQLNLFPAQDPNSMFGKTVTIDLNSKEYKIVTMGHKNPQGLVYSQLNDMVFSSEHQSKGGDEINLLKIDKSKIHNYGWAISSYGDHYDYVSKKDRKKYPLYKSHEEHGFLEPLIYFNPAIAPSEIIIDYEIKNEIQFILSSLKAKSLFELSYKKIDNKIKIGNTLKIGSRIRDLFNSKSYILLALEGSTALAIMQRN